MFRPLRYALATSILIVGCYQSPVPISTNAEPFDAALGGTWAPVDGDSDDWLAVLQFDNGYYYVEQPWDFVTADTTRLRARAYLTRVADATFVNVQDIQGEDRSYSFFRLAWHADSTISLTPLKSMPKFSSSEDLQRFLRVHLSDSSIYDEETRFTKVR
jgi:hypothetical protein